MRTSAGWRLLIKPTMTEPLLRDNGDVSHSLEGDAGNRALTRAAGWRVTRISACGNGDVTVVWHPYCHNAYGSTCMYLDTDRTGAVSSSRVNHLRRHLGSVTGQSSPQTAQLFYLLFVRLPPRRARVATLVRNMDIDEKL
jgi:hypothetical protein